MIERKEKWSAKKILILFILEFLFTYGWAILLVLAIVMFLIYAGVLSPDRFLVN